MQNINSQHSLSNSYYLIVDEINNNSIINDKENVIMKKYYDFIETNQDHNIAINNLVKKEHISKQKVLATISNGLRKLRNELIRNFKYNRSFKQNSLLETILGEINVLNDIIFKNSNKIN